MSSPPSTPLPLTFFEVTSASHAESVIRVMRSSNCGWRQAREEAPATEQIDTFNRVVLKGMEDSRREAEERRQQEVLEWTKQQVVKGLPPDGWSSDEEEKPPASACSPEMVGVASLRIDTDRSRCSGGKRVESRRKEHKGYVAAATTGETNAAQERPPAHEEGVATTTPKKEAKAGAKGTRASGERLKQYQSRGVKPGQRIRVFPMRRSATKTKEESSIDEQVKACVIVSSLARCIHANKSGPNRHQEAASLCPFQSSEA